MLDVSELMGKTFSDVKEQEDEIIFTAIDGRCWKMFHEQDCCEQVVIEDICGDLADLVGSPILKAEETISGEDSEGIAPKEYRDSSFTWTFYHFATLKGYVTIRWYGTSNGYYSECVSLKEMKDGG